MSKTSIIGPYFFEDQTVNQQNYLALLKDYVYPILKRKRIEKRFLCQQDGAPPHFSKDVRAWLNENFNGRWISRDGPISWAPRSLDLTPLDFYLWGFVKANVYKTQVNDIDDLKNRIEEQNKSIKKETLITVFDNIVKRLKFCIDVNGDTFEQYL